MIVARRRATDRLLGGDLTELTLKALLLGAILSMLLAAANAYIGLLVGLTVSASIPAAAVQLHACV